MGEDDPQPVRQHSSAEEPCCRTSSGSRAPGDPAYRDLLLFSNPSVVRLYPEIVDLAHSFPDVKWIWILLPILPRHDEGISAVGRLSTWYDAGCLFCCGWSQSNAKCLCGGARKTRRRRKMTIGNYIVSQYCDAVDLYLPYVRGYAGLFGLETINRPFEYFDGYQGNLVCMPCGRRKVLYDDSPFQAYSTLYKVDKVDILSALLPGRWLREETGFQLGDASHW